MELNLSNTARGNILAGLRLVQRMIAERPGLVLTDLSGTPSRAAGDAINAYFDEAGPLSMHQIDRLCEVLVTGQLPMGADAALRLLIEFDQDIGRASLAGEEINGANAVDWISQFAPRVREELQRLRVPVSAVPASPSVHGLLSEFDARFGDDVEEDQHIPAADAVEWLCEFAARARGAIIDANGAMA